ncbi:hypothetical protein SBA6_160009 [Candidatus Sulfopaludibacter sp. SbA6]|nr:hypothetical protein SBA6_160009 [Candidatus Sulfopaludibacter sp. SbA6]
MLVNIAHFRLSTSSLNLLRVLIRDSSRQAGEMEWNGAGRYYQGVSRSPWKRWKNGLRRSRTCRGLNRSESLRPS